MFKLGIEHLLSSSALKKSLSKRRVALVAHQASVDQKLQHTMDLLKKEKGLQVTCAFGPQHGMRGEKQDNMIESEDYLDPVHEIPVYSLYGRVRRPTKEMLDQFDVLLFDLQDVGCRIYTFVTTLVYLMEDCARAGKALWVLDRPNPIGRPIEGSFLREEFRSFVGEAPVPMRYGLTLGELATWYKDHKKLKLDLKVVPLKGYRPGARPGYGWPGSYSWVNPSPNLPRLSGVRSYAGTVLVEGTWISEGRGTTLPLELFGAPEVEGEKLLNFVKSEAPKLLKSCRLRPCYFEPVFQKQSKKLCGGLQIHLDDHLYKHADYKPYRLVSLLLRAVREIYPQFDLWRTPPYEYEDKLLPIDIISGGDHLRKWVDSGAPYTEWDEFLSIEEEKWRKQYRAYFLY